MCPYMEYWKAYQHMRTIVEGPGLVQRMEESTAALTKMTAILGAMMTD